MAFAGHLQKRQWCGGKLFSHGQLPTTTATVNFQRNLGIMYAQRGATPTRSHHQRFGQRRRFDRFSLSTNPLIHFYHPVIEARHRSTVPPGDRSELPKLIVSPRPPPPPWKESVGKTLLTKRDRNAQKQPTLLTVRAIGLWELVRFKCWASRQAIVRMCYHFHGHSALRCCLWTQLWTQFFFGSFGGSSS